MSTYRKKLIEVALPLDAINRACKADKNRKTGTIRNLHKWFAPMPVPALRAIIFSALVNDPESSEDRDQLLRFVANLVSSGPEAPASALAEEAQRIILDSVGTELPVVLDPFCGGGSTLVEAQRLGLPCQGSDLNPVPVLISKVLTQIPQEARGTEALTSSDELGLCGLRGLTEDVRRYAGEVYEKAWSELKASYPVAPNGDPVIAWWWCRTVASPDPTKQGAHTPIVQNWMLSKEEGRKNFVQPLVDQVSGRLEFEVRTGGDPQESAKGRCVFTDSPYSFDYLKSEGKAGRLGVRLMAMISKGEEGRAYHSPSENHESSGLRVPSSELEFTPLPSKGLGFRVQAYGFQNWEELFTPRQQLALSTFARLVSEVPIWVERDGGAESRGVAIATILGLCVGRLAHFSSTQTRWKIDSRNSVGKAESGFGRNDLPMLWDFVEVNPFGRSVGDWLRVLETSLSALKFTDERAAAAAVGRCDARESGKEIAGKALVVTDPPYFSAIGYADLSDYFYVWIRRALLSIEPELFSTIQTPKAQELIADSGRHGSQAEARSYFVEGFEATFSHLRTVTRPDLPIVIVYASREQEQGSGGSPGGWEAMLEAVCRAELAVVGTWPIHGTGGTRMRGLKSNALATYVVIVCRPRDDNCKAIDRGTFVRSLRQELPPALENLQAAGIAPVDLAQAIIGPGMEVYSRHLRVVDTDGSDLSVRDALMLINQALVEVLGDQEGVLDSESQFAVDWFENFQFDDGPFGVADNLARARNTSVDGIKKSGVAAGAAGTVRLLKRSELPDNWDPDADDRLTVWEAVQHLIKRLDEQGEAAAGTLLARLGPVANQARDLAYRLFAACERKGWSEEAQVYNGLVLAWPDLLRLAEGIQQSGQVVLFE